MKLVREKIFSSFIEGKNEILDILPIHTRMYIELNETKEENLKNNSLYINTDNIELNIDKKNKFTLYFNNDQFMYLSRSFNIKGWEVNYEKSTGLTARDINMILNN